MAFNSLKQALVAGPQLAHFDLSKQFVVPTDVSKIAIGAVPLQRSEEGVERPISFSKKLSAPQQNYSTFERECLAVVAAAQHFRIYLLGCPFILRTDHKALSWLLSKEPKGSGRVSGWIASLIEYPIEIEYLKGSENTIADILSRFTGHAVDQMVPTDLASGILTYACPVNVADGLELRTHWLNEQRADPTISRVAHYGVAKTKTDDDEIQIDPVL